LWTLPITTEIESSNLNHSADPEKAAAGGGILLKRSVRQLVTKKLVRCRTGLFAELIGFIAVVSRSDHGHCPTPK